MDVSQEGKGNYAVHAHTYFIHKYFRSVLLPEHLQPQSPHPHPPTPNLSPKQSGKSHINSWEAAH